MTWFSIRRHRKSSVLLRLAIVCLCLTLVVISGIVNSANPETVILVTAFEPFGNHPVNSSWEVVRRLEGKYIHGHRVVTVRLPVVWLAVWSPMRSAIDQYQPRLIINVGEGGTSRLELVHSALNVYGKIPDNTGAQPTAKVITVNGPDHYDTTVNLGSIVDSLSANGITANVSPNAGEFICNYINYRSHGDTPAKSEAKRFLTKL